MTGSTILSLFSRIWTVGLTKACPINLRQRGFIRWPSCSKNLKLLQLLIRYAKREHQPIRVVFADLAKAFDNISHSDIIMALKQKGIDDRIIALIQILYRNINTQRDLKNEQLDPIWIQIGVKQGDAMSPILFNPSVTLYCASWKRKAMGSSTARKR